MTRRHERTDAANRRAREVIPGGVSSAPRAHQHPYPVQVQSAEGSRIQDIDANTYIDYLGGYGPLLLGHRPEFVLDAMSEAMGRGVLFGLQHVGEAVVAEKVAAAVPSVEMVSFFSSGSEAVHAAIGIARGFTGRRLIVKFEGHYHGWIQPIGVNQPGQPAAEETDVRIHTVPGWPDSGDVLVAPWNDLSAIDSLLSQRGSEIAGVIMEPIVCNGGCLTPSPGYLAGLRALCDRHGILVVFDEIITGFRLALGGAQEVLGFSPDITVLGKTIASGLPLSAVGGRRDVMKGALNAGVALRGTYNGNPISLAAARATIDHLQKESPGLYEALEQGGASLAGSIADLATEARAPLICRQVGSVLALFWGVPKVETYSDVIRSNKAALSVLEGQLAENGVLIMPGGRMYLSTKHEPRDIEETLLAFERALPLTLASVATGPR